MGIIRKSFESDKYPSTPFYSADVPLNARILLDDINELVVFIKPLYGFDLVYEHITYDELDKLNAAGIRGKIFGDQLKRKLMNKSKER